MVVNYRNAALNDLARSRATTYGQRHPDVLRKILPARSNDEILRSTCSENVPVGSALADAVSGTLRRKPGPNTRTPRNASAKADPTIALFMRRGCGAAA